MKGMMHRKCYLKQVGGNSVLIMLTREGSILLIKKFEGRNKNKWRFELVHDHRKHTTSTKQSNFMEHKDSKVKKQQ